MRPASRSRVFAIARFAAAFAILIFPWSGLGRAFVDAVGAAATAVADPITASSNLSVTVRSARPNENQPDWCGIIDVKRDFPEGPVRQAGALDLRRAGYLQFATFLSLAAGWPPKSGRRALIASAVVVGVVSAVIAVPIFDFLRELGIASFGAWGGAMVALVRRALVAAPGMAYAIPGMAWVAIMQPRLPNLRIEPHAKPSVRAGSGSQKSR